MSEVLKFEHEAMKTTFSIRMVNVEATDAREASRAAFSLLDELEQSLSRYIHGSDVWQINHMRSGDSLLIHQDCYDCLQLALQAYAATEGLFDPTIGTRIEYYKNKQSGEPPSLSGQLMLDPKRPQVHCVTAGREVDLGGIGKGYALDRLAELLREWSIESALLGAGSSTQLAMGSTAWAIELPGEHAKDSLELSSAALSASGSSIQGAHILFPHDSQVQSLQHTRVWVMHTSAALADAWSTAAMLTVPKTIQSFESPPPTLIYETPEGFTHWPATQA